MSKRGAALRRMALRTGWECTRREFSQFTRDLQEGRVLRGFTYRRNVFYGIVRRHLMDTGFLALESRFVPSGPAKVGAEVRARPAAHPHLERPSGSNVLPPSLGDLQEMEWGVGRMRFARLDAYTRSTRAQPTWPELSSRKLLTRNNTYDEIRTEVRGDAAQ